MTYAQILETAQYIQSRIGTVPEVGIILGTGLGGLAKEVENPQVIEYSEIPHFPIPTVESHKGKLIFGKMSGKNIVMMQGRFHFYEGYSMQQVVLPVRVMKLLGAKTLFVSNVAGGLNPAFEIGDVMLIADHINLHYENPLTGKNLDELGVRFPDMYEPYSFDLLEKAKKISAEKGLGCKEGVYVSVPGPNLETRAEYKYLSIIGADAVGMSTVPEVIAAVHCGLKVFAVSGISDLCYEGKLKPVSIAEVIAAAMVAEPKMVTLFKELLKVV